MNINENNQQQNNNSINVAMRLRPIRMPDFRKVFDFPFLSLLLLLFLFHLGFCVRFTDFKSVVLFDAHVYAVLNDF